MISEDKILTHFIKNHPVDTVRILERQPIAEIVLFMKKISASLAVEIFKRLERYTAVKCLEMLDTGQSAAIIEKLPIEIASLLLRRMDKDRQESIIKMVKKEIAAPLGKILQYPADSAAAIMDPLIFTLPEDITVKEALKRVRNRPEKAIYYLYIVQRDHLLAGVINMRELMLAKAEDLLSYVMHSNVVSIPAEMNFSAVLNHSGWLEYHALPVVDHSGAFWGAIRYETIRRIEKDSRDKNTPHQITTTSSALGELYRIGFSGLIRGAANPYPRRNT